MAKKTRKKATAKAAKTSKAASKKKGATTKGRKSAAPRKSKSLARPAAKPVAAPKPTEPAKPSFLKRVEKKAASLFTGIADTLADAEQLHEKLDPGVSREPE